MFVIQVFAEWEEPALYEEVGASRLRTDAVYIFFSTYASLLCAFFYFFSHVYKKSGRAVEARPDEMNGCLNQACGEVGSAAEE